MHDFNFFEPYLTKGRQTGTASFPYIRLIIVLLFVLSAWPLFNLSYGFWLKYEAESLKTQVTASEKYPLLDEAEATKQYLLKRQGQLVALVKADSALKDSDWLDEPFLFSLLSTVPKDLIAEEISLMPDQRFKITGKAAGKPAIAEFEHNLRETGRFDSLYVDSISNKDGTYSFQMQFELKGGGNDAPD